MNLNLESFIPSRVAARLEQGNFGVADPLLGVGGPPVGSAPSLRGNRDSAGGHDKCRNEQPCGILGHRLAERNSAVHCKRVQVACAMHRRSC